MIKGIVMSTHALKHAFALEAFTQLPLAWLCHGHNHSNHGGDIAATLLTHVNIWCTVE